jgi:hypothetical protein
MSMVGSLGGADGDPEAPTINIEKYQRWAPWVVLAENPGVPTINTKNR